MKHILICTLLALFGIVSLNASPVEKPNRTLEERVETLEKGESLFRVNIAGNEFRVSGSSATTLALIVGCFCAVWAQNNRRSPWLWILMGAVFAPITLLVLLAKNGRLRREEHSFSKQS